MSFWGGFVEGVSEKVTEAIDKDVARTDSLVDDTIKIGIQKTLDVQEEIKKDKRRIRGELEMLTNQGFSVAKAASIVKAGMTTSIIKMKNDTDYKGNADGLWDGTTKFAEDNKLTIQDVVNKLSYQPPLDFGNLNVAPRKTGILSALGLSPDIDSQIKEGVQGRVGSMNTGGDRSDISILPGSIPLTAKSQFDTKKNMTTDQKLLELLTDKNTKNGVLDKQGLTNDILVSKNPNLVKQLGLNELLKPNINNAASPLPSINELKKLQEEANNGNVDSRNLLKGHLENYSVTATKKQYDDLIKKLR